MQHECLQIEQTECDCEHTRDDEREKNSRTSVTKSGKDSCAKSREVGQRSEGGRWNPSDTGIDATEHSGATPRRTTNNVVTGKMRDSEISSISQPNQRDDRHDGVKNYPGARPGKWRRLLC